jgi:hypothetical protein
MNLLDLLLREEVSASVVEAQVRGLCAAACDYSDTLRRDESRTRVEKRVQELRRQIAARG